MKLNNPFTQETRNLYLYRTDCDKCGSNQSLQLHHITGRDSNSPLNASLVCYRCHEHLNHNTFEEQYLFVINLGFLKRSGYKLKEEDINFMRDHERLIKNSGPLTKWLESKSSLSV